MVRGHSSEKYRSENGENMGPLKVGGAWLWNDSKFYCLVVIRGREKHLVEMNPSRRRADHTKGHFRPVCLTY